MREDRMEMGTQEMEENKKYGIGYTDNDQMYCKECLDTVDQYWAVEYYKDGYLNNKVFNVYKCTRCGEEFWQNKGLVRNDVAFCARYDAYTHSASLEGYDELEYHKYGEYHYED